jgi:hypothetical protein
MRRPFAHRFVALYGALVLAAVAAMVSFAVLLFARGYTAPRPWSAWQPSAAGPAATAQSIARHVGSQYRLTETGTELLTITPKTPPVVANGKTKLAVSAIAERRGARIHTFAGESSVQYGLCATGPSCTLPAEAPTLGVVRLVRQAALELALHTFKHVPAAQTVVAFLPPVQGAPTNMLFFFERAALEPQLKRPLNETLPSQPPLPSELNGAGRTPIDRLTVPKLRSYQVSELQPGGAALVLGPAA